MSILQKYSDIIVPERQSILATFSCLVTTNKYSRQNGSSEKGQSSRDLVQTPCTASAGQAARSYRFVGLFEASANDETRKSVTGLSNPSSLSSREALPTLQTATQHIRSSMWRRWISYGRVFSTVSLLPSAPDSVYAKCQVDSQAIGCRINRSCNNDLPRILRS